MPSRPKAEKPGRKPGPKSARSGRATARAAAAGMTQKKERELKLRMLSDFSLFLKHGEKSVDDKRKAEMAVEGETRDGRVVRNSVGQPTVMTTDVMAKLEVAFKCACDDKTAAKFAGIGYTTLTRFFKRHPEYREMTYAWKSDPIVYAWKCLVEAARNNPIWAERLLDRLDRTGRGKLGALAAGSQDAVRAGYDFVQGVRIAAEPYERYRLPYGDEEAAAGVPEGGEAIDVESRPAGEGEK